MDRSISLAKRLDLYERILIWGDMGSGKSTLTQSLGQALADRHGGCQVLCLDPGSPPFGVPGAVSRGWWQAGRFQWGDQQALCTLDAGRFRLPLLTAARRLIEAGEAAATQGPLLIDPPGVVRGVGGAELLMALLETLGVEAVVGLGPLDEALPLADELASGSIPVITCPVKAGAHRPARQQRNAQRTQKWERFLEHARKVSLPLANFRFLGTPPPRNLPSAWERRQAAVMEPDGSTRAMGEVVRLMDTHLELRLVTIDGKEDLCRVTAGGILIRDAGRDGNGHLTTVHGRRKSDAAPSVPEEMLHQAKENAPASPPISTRVGSAWATLVGGVMGDPLLHVRLRHRKLSLFFDLGNAAGLSPRVAHRVRAVFLSHAHLDHIAGFTWFLRSRIGYFGPCLVFGPPGTIRRIEHFLGAITWDRIAANGPIFEVSDIIGDRLRSARLQAGRPRVELPEHPIAKNVVWRDDDCRVLAATCDHGIPSMAYALIFDREINVRKERLAEKGWAAGPWLGHLKACIARGAMSDRIALPDGSSGTVAALAEALTLIRPGKKLVYAADMADTPTNREALTTLAGGAHTLFCETAFTAADREKAAATQHLTTTAAMEIARAAAVERLVPFHFSKRYESDPGRLFRELRAQDSPVMVIGRL